MFKSGAANCSRFHNEHRICFTGRAWLKQSMTKVLVIDDSPDVCQVVGLTLQSNGYQVFVAEDGLAGVQLAQQHLPDLIFCDVNMPRLDGYATLTALRQQSSTATIPFIFLTGAADKMNVRQGMELGADDYLTKPFTVAELLAAVKARLEKQVAVTRKAEQKLEELRGNISLALPHELLTPLTGILGYSSLLAENHDRISPSELFELANNMQESALRLQRTIENFLLYSQVELVAADTSKLAALRTGEFPLAQQHLTDLAFEIARRAGRGEDLSVQIEEAVLPIAPDKLQKCVGELLDNAFKFSHPGDPVSLASFVDDNRFTLAITDHGRGMTPDQIAAIGAHMQFERKFYEQQGSGLGLIIAKRLTEIHGGSFAIESVPELQTTVQISFAVSARPTSDTVRL
jgi:two-component system, sensor histidine kinase and response regulator